VSQTAAAPAPSPDVDVLDELGLRRRLTRLTTADGFFFVAALDHPENYLALFDTDISRVSHDTVVRSKLELAAHLAPHASALLLDPVWSLGQAIATATLPRNTGAISSIELLAYTPQGFGLETRLRPEWTPEKIARAGVDGVKVYLSYRAELDVVASQRALIGDLAARCHAVGLPLVVEPIWYPLPGEDAADPAVQARRAAAIVASAAEFAAIGADVLKVQFPGSVRTPEARRSAEAAARELDAALDRPWVLLSEGVGYDEFAVQVEVVSAAGASGYMAGRAIWGDAVGAIPEGERRAGLERAARRLQELNVIVRANGRPHLPQVPVDEAVTALPEDWHTRFGAPTTPA
jgi:tagatose-1,6-bisphosphate aldolase